jgi:hypothetical protein
MAFRAAADSLRRPPVRRVVETDEFARRPFRERGAARSGKALRMAEISASISVNRAAAPMRAYVCSEEFLGMRRIIAEQTSTGKTE